jgi:hypothetical protein
MQETFETYARMTGHGTEAKALAAHDKYGLNRFDVPIPPFMDLLKEHLVAPFFCFQWVTGSDGRETETCWAHEPMLAFVCASQLYAIRS